MVSQRISRVVSRFHVAKVLVDVAAQVSSNVDVLSFNVSCCLPRQADAWMRRLIILQ